MLSHLGLVHETCSRLVKPDDLQIPCGPIVLQGSFYVEGGEHVALQTITPIISAHWPCCLGLMGVKEYSSIWSTTGFPCLVCVDPEELARSGRLWSCAMTMSPCLSGGAWRCLPSADTTSLKCGQPLKGLTWNTRTPPASGPSTLGRCQCPGQDQ